MLAKTKFSGHRLYVLLIFPLIYAILVYPFLPFARPSSSSIPSRHLSDTHTQPQGYDHVHKKRTESDRPESCLGFPGDEDSYGLGIRIGIYLQSFTTTTANAYLPKDAIAMRTVSLCFQAAIMAGILFLTITKGSNLFAVEVYIMLVFYIFGVGSQGVFMLKISKLGLCFQHLISTIFVSYGCWFTFVGMDRMMPPPASRVGGCSVYIFFFSKVNLFGWYHTFLKVWSVLFIIAQLLLLYQGAPKLFKMCWKDSKASGTTSARSPSVRLGAIIIMFILFILSVELTIKWSKINGVEVIGGTGQLFPLIMSCGNMGAIFIKLVLNIQKKREEEVGKGRKQNFLMFLFQTYPHITFEEAIGGVGREVRNGNGVLQQKVGSNATDVPPSDNTDTAFAAPPEDMCKSPGEGSTQEVTLNGSI